MARRVWVAALVVVSASVGPRVAASAGAGRSAVVRELRAIPSAQLTRIVIDCSQKVAYRLRRAAGVPTQITVDLRAARLPRQGLPLLSFRAGPLRLVRAVRTAYGVRLVMKARGKASAAAFPLLNPFRLVVDVRGPQVEIDASRPRRAAGAGEPAENGRRQGGSRRTRVVIDAGHGGKDPGAVGVHGVREKDVALAISRRLARKLRDSGEFDVVLTRARDVYVPLEERTARANAEKAEIFVSIHANASRKRRRSSGVETYYLNNTDDRATIRLARLENGLAAATPSQEYGRDVKWILSDLLQNYKVEESAMLAAKVQQALVAQLRRHFSGVRDLGVKQGPFFVLVGATMPGVVVEVSFLSHPREGARLATSAYQETLAQGILQGLRAFVDNERRAGTL